MEKKLLGGLMVMLLLALVTAPAAWAQMELKWEVGAKGGYALAEVDGADDITLATGQRNGFLGGLFVAAQLHEYFGVRLEGLYITKGATDTGPVGDVTVKFDYVEVPLLAVGMYPINEMFTVSAFAGPAVAFNINAEAEVVSTSGTTTTDLNDSIKSIDFGAVAGIGGAYDVGRMKILIDARLEMAFTKFDDTGADRDIKNRNFAVTAGVAIPIPMQTQ
jgi:hypothetical protein